MSRWTGKQCLKLLNRTWSFIKCQKIHEKLKNNCSDKETACRDKPGNYFFFINVSVRVSLRAPRLILQVLKLTTVKISSGYHISNHRARTWDHRARTWNHMENKPLHPNQETIFDLPSCKRTILCFLCFNVIIISPSLMFCYKILLLVNSIVVSEKLMVQDNSFTKSSRKNINITRHLRSNYTHTHLFFIWYF